MYGYSLDETLSATQTLRDKYKAITYNRSDCQYLAEEHFKEAPEVVATALSNIGRSDLPVEYDRHSRCFNDKNVSAHHAIIPQNKHVDISSMSERERNVYISIVERYAMQFLPPETRLESKYSFKLKNGSFRYSASAVQGEGYKRSGMMTRNLFQRNRLSFLQARTVLLSFPHEKLRNIQTRLNDIRRELW